MTTSYFTFANNVKFRKIKPKEKFTFVYLMMVVVNA